MALTDTKIRQTKPGDKPIKLVDGKGLYLDVRPSGAKIWRYRYWITSDKDGIYTIGEYPAVSLADARKAREAAREQVKQGLNPTHVKDAQRVMRMADADNSFKAVALEWIESNRGHWSANYLRQVETFLPRDVFPKIGALPIRMVGTPHLREIIKEVEKRGAQSIAVLIRQWAGQIFRHAIRESLADSDPTYALRGALKRKPVRHNPPLSREDVPVFLEQLEKYGGYRGTVIALRLMMLTFVRTVELRMAEWKEFDLDAAVWRIPGERMKMKEEHIVPLSRQAVALLRELQTLSGGQRYLFPNLRNPKRCMTATTINRAIERMGFGGRFSGHGFRSTASTMLHELDFPEKVIERQLAHAERNKVKAAYNHAEFMPARRKMMQAWADFIDTQAATA